MYEMRTLLSLNWSGSWDVLAKLTESLPFTVDYKTYLIYSGLQIRRNLFI